MAKKRFFAKHAKSSAALISIGLHLLIVVIALSYVAVTVIQKDDKTFEAKPVKRPVKKLKKLQVPIKEKRNKPKPKLRKQIVVKNINRQTPEFKMPEITGVKGGMGSAGDGGGSVEAIGFTMPEMDFFGTKANGEKVCFLVHFGPATMASRMNGNKATYTPFSRMTALTIRNRLADLISELPSYTLFNIAAFFAADTWAMSPNMITASSANKAKVINWMQPVNPIDPEANDKYEHCFSIGSEARGAVNRAASSWPTRVEEELPFFAPKWVYPYEIDELIRKKYAPDAAEFTDFAKNPNYNVGQAFSHWGRSVAWALLEQKPDTIFILTTNYIDGWQVIDTTAVGWEARRVKDNEPNKMARSFANMIRDTYGPDKKSWPSINVIVLTEAGKDSESAYKCLNEDFGIIWKSFNGQGSVIEDIKDYMNEDEKDLYFDFKNQFGTNNSDD
ncbi:MAG: hypothetical protein VYB95_01610 [Verrucomicrobiota bacterium]|nr:hypothetical protein [Verrucomicrobiota bacterium]